MTLPKQQRDKITVKINGYYLFWGLAILITGILTFSEILNINNYMTSDSLDYDLNLHHHEDFRCWSSDTGFTDFFTGKPNCSYSNTPLGTVIPLALLLFNSFFIIFIYYGWFHKFNSKYHWIGLKVE